MSLLSITFIVLIFLMGQLTIYLYRDTFYELYSPKFISKREKVEELERLKEFEVKFPKTNKIPGLNFFIRWMYKEGRVYSCSLVLLTIVGFGLRIYNLDFLSPFRDEYYHLVGAKRFLLEGQFNYSRASFLTYIIGMLFKLNGDTSLFLARIPSVIAGTLSIIMIYFLAKNINKKVGLISSYLITFSPLCIGMSRFAREYQIYFLIIILYLICLIQGVKKINSAELMKKPLKLIGLLLYLSAPMIYYLFIEQVDMILELYFMAGIFLTINLIFNLKESENQKIIFKLFQSRKLHFIALMIAGAVILYLPNLIEHYTWLLNWNINKSYGEMFFNPNFTNNSYLQWFSGLFFTKLLSIVIFLFPTLFLYKNRYFVSYLSIFFMILVMFTFLVDRYYQSRYVYYAFPFYIIIYAASLYTLIDVRKIFKNKSSIFTSSYNIFILIIILCFFSPFTGIIGLLNEENGQIDLNGDLTHEDSFELIDYLSRTNFSEKDVLITSNPGIFQYYYNYSFIENPSEWPLKRFDYREGKPVYDYGNLYHYYYLAATLSKPSESYVGNPRDKVSYLDENARVNYIIQAYDSGWIIIDKHRNRYWNERGLPLQNFSIGNKEVEYIGSTPELLYHDTSWQKVTQSIFGFDIYKWEKAFKN